MSENQVRDKSALTDEYSMQSWKLTLMTGMGSTKNPVVDIGSNPD